MIQLLKFEFYRLLKSKISWIILAVMTVLPVLAVIVISLLIKLGNEDRITPDVAKFITWLVISYFYKWVPMVTALFIPIFTGRNFRDGFIRNMITAGHTRFQIFASAVISKAVYTALLCTGYVLGGILSLLVSPVPVNLNGGEMLLRALTLMLSAVATSVLYTTLVMVIRNKAVPIILSVLFVMSFTICGLLASSFSYNHKMVRQYSKIWTKTAGENGFASEFDEDGYFNVGWYAGHPLFVFTNASMENEFIFTSSSLVTDINGATSYSDEISRNNFSSISSLLFSKNAPIVSDDDIKKHVDGAYVSVERAELEYNIKSVVWIMIYFGAGYAIFRKKNIF